MIPDNSSFVGPVDDDPSSQNSVTEDEGLIEYYVMEGLLTPDEAVRLLEGRQI